MKKHVGIVPKMSRLSKLKKSNGSEVRQKSLNRKFREISLDTFRLSVQEGYPMISRWVLGSRYLFFDERIYVNWASLRWLKEKHRKARALSNRKNEKCVKCSLINVITYMRIKYKTHFLEFIVEMR